jgi:hypothetical protein
MRRAQLVLVVLAASALGGCARWYDRNAQLGSDPVLWFLGGAPTEVQLDWPRREVPWLAPLGSADLVSAPTPRPLDYPRGWSPDNPPYAPAGDVLPVPSADDDGARCNGACDLAPASAHHARGGDARGERGTSGD